MTLGNFIENKLKVNIGIILYKINLLPKIYHQKIKALIHIKKYYKKFKKLKLSFNESGYHKVDPMPSNEELNDFYAKIYPLKSNAIYNPIRIRDIDHYKLIIKIFPDFNDSKKNILNFGSGHGGISILFKIAGHTVYNLDPSETIKYFDEDWHNLKGFNELKINMDLIYASHSLEHVTDIDEVLLNFNKISNDYTKFFFEVPNHAINKKHTIDPPHTYYFSRLFFQNNFNNIKHNQTYSLAGDNADEDDGDVIRFVSQIK